MMIDFGITDKDVEIFNSIGVSEESLYASAVTTALQTEHVNLNLYYFVDRCLTMIADPENLPRDDYFTIKGLLLDAAKRQDARV